MATAAAAVLTRLEALGLLRPGALPQKAKLAKARPETVPLLLCDLGALEGGLSVALDVRPDELAGPLCTALGGSARTLKIDDVRDRPELELVILHQGRKERWSVPDTEALAHNLNDLCRDDPEANVAVVLGDWNDATQLWCVPRRVLPTLLDERWFEPRNRRQLESLAGRGED